jgi:hypothetical protein
VYLGKQKQHATAQITATHGTVLQLIRRVEGLVHKIYMDNNFTSPALMICFNEESMRVEHFAMTGVECHEILDQKI